MFLNIGIHKLNSLLFLFFMLYCCSCIILGRGLQHQKGWKQHYRMLKIMSKRNINLSCKPQLRKTEGQKHLDFYLPLKLKIKKFWENCVCHKMLKICFKDQNCLKILVFQIFHLISIMFKNMSMTSTLHELKYCAIYKLFCIRHMHRNLKLPQLFPNSLWQVFSTWCSGATWYSFVVRQRYLTYL